MGRFRRPPVITWLEGGVATPPQHRRSANGMAAAPLLLTLRDSCAAHRLPAPAYIPRAKERSPPPGIDPGALDRQSRMLTSNTTGEEHRQTDLNRHHPIESRDMLSQITPCRWSAVLERCVERGGVEPPAPQCHCEALNPEVVPLLDVLEGRAGALCSSGGKGCGGVLEGEGGGTVGASSVSRAAVVNRDDQFSQTVGARRAPAARVHAVTAAVMCVVRCDVVPARHCWRVRRALLRAW